MCAIGVNIVQVGGEQGGGGQGEDSERHYFEYQRRRNGSYDGCQCVDEYGVVPK
jgi:hypothetical protein